eukprot:jgi/Ulvmu1/7106/UM034_0012.1
MSVRLTVGDAAKSSAFEWLPCSINASCPCNRDEYFLVQDDNSTTPSTPVVHLRGRELKGAQTQLPPGYTLLHLQRGNSTLKGDNLETEWKAVGRADGCRIWEHDMAPCNSTGRIQAMDWLKLAPSMHSPIPVHAVENRLKQNAGSSAANTATV